MMVATVGINIIFALGIWILLGLLILKAQANYFEKEITRLKKEKTRLEKELDESLDRHIQTHEEYKIAVERYKVHANDLNDKIKQLEGVNNER